MELEILLVIVIVGIAGTAFGYFLRWIVSLGKRGSMELEIKKMILAAKEDAQKITEAAEKKSRETLDDLKKEEKEKEQEYKRKEERLMKKEELLDKRQSDIDQEVENIKQKIEEIKSLKEKALNETTRIESELERVSALDKETAKEELFKIMERQMEEDLVVRMRKLENEGFEKLDKKAKEILAASIQRLASSTASESMTTALSIPSDDIKGKIIGKEGRNIKAFERAAGVEIIVDDTPGSIVISSFDPVRRQIARVALENLILDGRIQPAKIEEMVEKSRVEINKIIKEKGEQAAYECRVFNLDPRIISILGRLYFRTSYGQNVLQHSIEMAHIAGILAEELSADVAIARAGALLHDIGKAVDHEIQGTHVEIGRRILQKFGADEKIVQAMQSHHEEYPYETIESIIVQTADAISGGRPGARRDSAENYLKRLQDLEAIANSFPGVEKSYALQAGREIRVFVTPEQISDLDARKIAREIATRIESELKYPGEIKVNVIRENRVIEYAR
ncbi:MAG: ribonuclease Y [Candidatus Yonathbacteria bacterium CG_4_10_14_3_um_filter_47_65]|uniref:Ribonuclease Y n=1 Tax=Candidatus Yonathbacteria bacterium CG_4_9_14_0_8_um_filter_46_47 TaxID=1975106 RepID=A0A2M8DA08_9BACT|nr:MAG: ribonuclease Y [Candidatus Yonathbacteria bacterium CG23_combo_of_CG06-09_8_20_14_all_46_18]PIQ31252.1 MAG: ribonuclease Y [Candidatus Yonathbacteria bacterium CG17_big_fil_post_rev_8_21_14_2_50_46_19]PIX56057.1 MAG: ribonuclease Y [Candidatus Yonathbacteria bacterium CG_4_10_14_3_um_filter_47_65]PJB83990.1 MAG: ribonuclease Y [Candidatus Yonathbacteria bacterium CG_4_9_14_0_8_um_filter_46_47]PJC19692.1 MAG: ribonuclease Y [Candidatus Yonathbacteria bacterium CG_4_9_14_0_2_um_filter_47_